MIGRKHASLIANNPETRLSAIVAPEHIHNIEYAASMNVPWYPSVEAALRAQKIDAAIISSPNAFHFSQALDCIQRGIPSLVEKPLTDNLLQAEELVQAAEHAGTKVLVGHHRTYSPLLSVARDFLMSEQFGKAVTLQGSAQFYKPDDYYVAGSWRTKIGGGPILINLIHEIGIMRYLYGEIASVTACISRARRSFEVEDSAAITLAFDSGAIGTFILSDTSASSKSWEMTAGENPVYPHYSDQNCYHFGGTMGSLDFPSMRYRTYFGGHVQSWWQPFVESRLAFTRHDPLDLQLKHFVDVIHDRASPMVTARDGYLNMVVLEAIREAANSGREVRISDTLK